LDIELPTAVLTAINTKIEQYYILGRAKQKSPGFDWLRPCAA
jgi:hypothetical protein